MKQNIFPALKLTAFSFLLLVVIYTTLVWCIAQVAPNQGKGEFVTLNKKVVGLAKEGQLFNDDSYFWSRPSAVNYNAAASGASNKAPFDSEYLRQVQERITTVLAHNPVVTKEQIPSELVTASASGLDPHISPAAAYIQVKRIALVRNLAETEVRSLIDKQIEPPLLGLFGTRKINVLKLNIALDEYKQ